MKELLDDYIASGSPTKEQAISPQKNSSSDKNILKIISATELQKKDIPPIRFIVKDLITAGLTLLASPPKYGKSWAVLWLCLCVARGMKFLGFETQPCTCLYLALEDSERRLKSRMEKLLTGSPAPSNFYFAVNSNTLDTGLIEQLEGFLKEHPDTGLIVVDTLQKVRGATYGRTTNAYAADYKEISTLKTFADKHNIAVLLVHHLKKERDEHDAFNQISGTNGVLGAADTALVLTKENRDDKTATLSAIGRDIEQIDMMLEFNKDSCQWINLGDIDSFLERQANEDYKNNPIIITIKNLLNQSHDKAWTGTAKQLIDASQYISNGYISTSARGLSEKLKPLERLLLNNDNIIYERKSNGSGGGKHHFYYNVAEIDEMDELSEEPPF